jgi:uncharacterized protein YgbK (DUF1537 family)
MLVRIITDDFTSALDGTACFAELGWDTAVLTRPDSSVVAAVTSLDTDTREHAQEQDRDLVSACAHVWRDADVLVLQIDSTLRGRVARDCLAARAGSARARLLIAPAFPAAGRTTKGGHVLVDGVPVHETEFGRDPTLPVTESAIPALFAKHGVAVAVARDADDVGRLLASHDTLVVDARTEADLDALVARLAGRRDLLWAGSTGLLRALARTLPTPSEGARRVDVPRSDHPWVVVGSLNPRARCQLEVARERRQAHVLATDARRLHMPAARAALADIVQQVVRAVAGGACDGLVVTGGETALRIVDALPALTLRVCREVLPGVPLVEIRLPGASLPMITKAGGFGEDDALVTCIDALRQL